MAKTKTKVSNKKLPAVEKRSGTESWKWVVGILLSIAAIIIPYHEWKKDRAPAIRYVDYQLLGTLGQNAAKFSKSLQERREDRRHRSHNGKQVIYCGTV